MTFTDALTQAKAGAHITRQGRPSWLEFDHGCQCLTINNGQTHRVRWVPCDTDTQAEDWAVVFPHAEREEFPIPAYGKVMEAVLQLRDMWKERAENAEMALQNHIHSVSDAVLIERERCAKIAEAFSAASTDAALEERNKEKVPYFAIATMIATQIAAKIRSGE